MIWCQLNFELERFLHSVVLELGCTIPKNLNWCCFSVCLEHTKEGKVKSINVSLFVLFKLPDVSFFEIQVKNFCDENLFIFLVSGKNLFLASPDCKALLK
jgi:hypothetical protein